MSINRLNFPSTIETTTWYPQYQETNETLQSIAPKNFGVTKRTAGITASSIVNTKVTQLRLLYPDVNNGNIAREKTWHTFRTAEVGEKGSVNIPYNSTLPAGQSVNLDANVNITQGDVLASFVKTGVLKNGAFTIFTGLNITTSIPVSGTIRFTISNNSGGNIDLTNTVFYTQWFRSVDELAQNMYNYGARKGTSVFAEFVENGLPVQKMEEVFKKLSEIIIANEGGDVTTHNIFADYYDGLNGGSTDMNFGGTSGETPAILRDAISSQAKARQQQSVVGTTNSYYYTNNCFNYRHRMVGGYFDGIRLLTDGAYIYQTIYNIEKTYVALSNRKTAVFGWGSLEGVSGWIESKATWQRLPFKSPDGDIIRLSRASGSFELNQAHTFFSLLGADAYFMWDDGAFYGTDLKCWDVAHIGGSTPDKTRWQSLNGNEVQYDASNPSHPQRVCADSQAPWSDTAAFAHNAAFTAAWIYSRIVNRTTTLKYGEFNYSIGGVNKTGYNTSNIPVNGSLGNASVSRINNANVGQHNIVNQYEARKPIVMVGNGSEGYCIIVLNIFAGLTDTTTYNVQVDGTTQTISHVGTDLGVYLVNTNSGVLESSIFYS